MVARMMRFVKASFVTCLALYLGSSHGCLDETKDPCQPQNYKTLNDTTRNAQQYSSTNFSLLHDYMLMSGWYRSVSPGSEDMPRTPPAVHYCYALEPMWLCDDLPSLSEGIVVRNVCSVHYGDPRNRIYEICVKNCGEFNVYYLRTPDSTTERYCFGGDTYTSSSTDDVTSENTSPASTTLTEIPTATKKFTILFTATTVEFTTTTSLSTEESISSPKVSTTFSSTPKRNEKTSAAIKIPLEETPTVNPVGKLNPTRSPHPPVLYILIGVLAVLLLVAIFFILICRCYRYKHKQNHQNKNQVNGHCEKGNPSYIPSPGKDDYPDTYVYIDNKALDNEDNDQGNVSSFKNGQPKIYEHLQKNGKEMNLYQDLSNKMQQPALKNQITSALRTENDYQVVPRKC